VASARPPAALDYFYLELLSGWLGLSSQSLNVWA